MGLVHRNLAVPAAAGDPADRSLTHLVGLNFARSWCLSRLATAIAGGGTARMGSPAALRSMAAAHLEAALPLAASGEWMGDHWLHTFALLAVEAQAEEGGEQGPRRLTARL